MKLYPNEDSNGYTIKTVYTISAGAKNIK